MSPPLVLWAGAPVYPLIHRPPLVPGCAEVAEGVEAVTVRVPRPGHVQHPAVQCYEDPLYTVGIVSPGSEAGITVEVAAAGLPGVQGEGAPGPALPPGLLVTSVLTQHQCPQLATVPSPAI